ncbi:MAG: GGDEF domain-containing protein, partial [Spirochaetales bacterium]|nr:GGDEF domain-containing protein [Spirochaetales bacterium]
HESGDEVIIRIANTCTQNVRDDDIVCREGGDEFVIILPTCNEATATSIASNILKSFREPFKLKNGTTQTMSLSIGVYCNSTGSVDYIQALRFADQAQYAVKQNGRNNVLCYSQAIRDGLIPKDMIN